MFPLSGGLPVKQHGSKAVAVAVAASSFPLPFGISACVSQCNSYMYTYLLAVPILYLASPHLTSPHHTTPAFSTTPNSAISNISHRRGVLSCLSALAGLSTLCAHTCLVGRPRAHSPRRSPPIPLPSLSLFIMRTAARAFRSVYCTYLNSVGARAGGSWPLPACCVVRLSEHVPCSFYCYYFPL